MLTLSVQDYTFIHFFLHYYILYNSPDKKNQDHLWVKGRSKNYFLHIWTASCDWGLIWFGMSRACHERLGSRRIQVAHRKKPLENSPATSISFPSLSFRLPRLSVASTEATVSQTVLSAMYFPTQTLSGFNQHLCKRSKRLKNLRPKPNAWMSPMFVNGPVGVSRKRSGRNSSGREYTTGSRFIALATSGQHPIDRRKSEWHTRYWEWPNILFVKSLVRPTTKGTAKRTFWDMVS